MLLLRFGGGPIPLFGDGHRHAGAKRRPLTMQFCYRGIRDQRMIAKAKDSHPEGRRRETGVCGMGQGGACRPVHPALARPPPVQSARGALRTIRRALRSAPAGVRDRARQQPRSVSPGRWGVFPLEGVAGDGAAAPAQGKSFPTDST